MTKTTRIAAPNGMTGLAVEPWGAGEIYAVAANWSQAGSPVMVYGDCDNGWGYDSHGRQVADFRHNDRAALESVLREAIEMGGDEPDDGEVEAILDAAVDCRPSDLHQMCEMLDGHGPTFAGNCVEDTAQDWLDNNFDADDANEWCEVGAWDAATAAEFRDAGLSADQVRIAADRLIEACDDAADDYTDGDPIYSACNGDTAAQEIIDAAKAE